MTRPRLPFAKRAVDEREQAARRAAVAGRTVAGPDVGEASDPYADLEASAGPPEGFRETGVTRRVIETPGYSFEVDPRGRRRPRERRIGESRMVEEREVDPVAPVLQGPPAPEYSGAIERLGAYLSGDDPDALVQPGRRDPLHAAEDLYGQTGYLGNPLARLAHGWGGFEMPGTRDVRNAVSSRDPTVLFPTAPEDPENPMQGPRDMRGRAGLYSAINAFTRGGADELAELAGADAEQVRRLSRQSRQQDPALAATGDIAGEVPWLAVPAAGATAPARIAIAGGQGLGTGMLRGALSSEGDAQERLRAGTRQAAIEGLLSSGTAGFGEGLAGLAGTISRWAPQRAATRAEDLTRAELNARGIWSGSDTEAARRFPGGREGLVDELNRMEAPLRAERIPAWAAEQVRTIGPRVGQAAEELTQRGAGVDMSQLAGQVEDLARTVEPRAGGRQIAGALRRDVADQWRNQAMAPPAGAAGPAGPPIPFEQAHAERMHIDDLAGDLPAQGLGRATGRLAEARGMLNRAMTESAQATDPALAQQWAQANRDYSVPAFLLSHGRGAERLNTMGGGAGMISRAVGAGQMLYGNPMGAVEATVGPAIQQEMRMAMPGIQARYLRRLVPALRNLGPRGEQWARTLEGASVRGGTAVAAAHAVLSRTQPEYRQAMERMQNEPELDEEEAPPDSATPEEDPYADLLGEE